MTKKLAKIASIVALCTASNLHALTIFEDDTNSFSIGGRFDIQMATDTTTFSQNNGNYIGGDVTDDFNMSPISPRFNFGFTHQVDENTVAEAFMEWKFVPDANSFNDKEPFANRLGYIGLQGDFGHVRLGKQYSVVSDVMGVTSYGYKADPDGAAPFTIGDGGALGTARMDNAIIYRANLGMLELGVQYAMEHEVTSGMENYDPNNPSDTAFINNNYGFGLRFHVSDEFTLGMTYSQTEIEISQNATDTFYGLNAGTHTSTMMGLSAKYENDTFKIAATAIPMADDFYTTGYTPWGAQEDLAGNNQVLADGAGFDILASINIAAFEPYAYLSQVGFDGSQENADKGVGESSRVSVALGSNYHYSDALKFGAEVSHTQFAERITPNGDLVDSLDTNLAYGVFARYIF